jgi:predicted dehydrogenase
MTTPLRFALLSAAHVHAPAYARALRTLPEAALIAVWDDDPRRGSEFAQQYEVPFLPDVDAPGAWDAFDAVLITAENAKHATLCQAACRAGKHVLCEKPLATTNEDAKAMIAAAGAASVTLATAFPMRHNLPARAMKRALDDGVIGEVLAVRATNHGQLPPGWFLDPALAGGGAVMDHTVHVLDLLRWYLQDEPVEVYAEISHGLHGLPVEDAAFLTITFASGAVATLDPSWSRPPSFPTWGDLTMEVSGTKGTINLDAFAQKIIHDPSQSAGTEWLSWGNDDNRTMLADFVAAVREGRPAAATGHDGARALAVALAAYESAALERPVAVSA